MRSSFLAFCPRQIFDSGPQRFASIECLFKGIGRLGFDFRFNVLGRSGAFRLHPMFSFLIDAGL